MQMAGVPRSCLCKALSDVVLIQLIHSKLCLFAEVTEPGFSSGAFHTFEHTVFVGIAISKDVRTAFKIRSNPRIETSCDSIVRPAGLLGERTSDRIVRFEHPEWTAAWTPELICVYILGLLILTCDDMS